MELPNTGSRLDSDSRVLTEIKVHDDPTKRGPTCFFDVGFCVKLVDRRGICFLSSYVLHSVVIAKSPPVRIKFNNEESWRTVERTLRNFQCLGKDTIRKVIRRVKTYIFWRLLRPRLLVVYVNKVVVNQDALYDWYRFHGAGIYRGPNPMKELVLKRISFEEMNLKDDDEEYCCSICLENLGEQEDVKVTRNMFSVCLEYFFMHKDAKLMCTPCNHIFHDHCILEWSRVSSNCPICRR